jgi:hypothetical protein
LVYRARDDRWWLRYPCATCGGVELPLLARPAVDHLASGLSLSLHAGACPGCETSRNRGGCGGVERTNVWYDTVLRDWVVRLPCTGSGDGAILPLEIRWFDAPLSTVYRAAGDLAFSGDAFEQLPND